MVLSVPYSAQLTRKAGLDESESPDSQSSSMIARLGRNTSLEEKKD